MSEEETAQRETFGHYIEEPLSAEEEAKLDHQVAALDREIISLESDKSFAAKQFGQQLKEKNKARNDILKVTTTKVKKVEYQCYNERDDRRGMILTRRADTGEIVDERAQTAEERNVPDDRQGNLFEGNAAAAAEPTDDDAEPEEGGGEDTDAALAEYAAAQSAAAGESNTAHAGADSDDSDEDDESDLGDPDDDSEGAQAH